MLGSVSVMQRAGELEHMVVHGQDANHHHHEDQSLHMEVDEGAVQHLHSDAGSNPAGLIALAWPAGNRVRSMSPPQALPSVWCSPILEGPLRPPCFTHDEWLSSSVCELMPFSIQRF